MELKASGQSTSKDVPAATKTIAILRLLSRSRVPLTLSEISSELHLVPSTCLHILRVLSQESMVNIDPRTKRYRTGLGILSLARSVLSRDALVGFFQREIDNIADRFGTSANATRIENGRTLAIGTSVPPGVYAINIEVGSRFPDYLGTTGRCLAAFGGNPEKIFSQLRKGHWANMPDSATWMQEVEACRRLGYAVDAGNMTAGVTVVAAPVLSPDGTVTHTIGTVGISQTAERIGIDLMGRALADVARRAYVDERP